MKSIKKKLASVVTCTLLAPMFLNVNTVYVDSKTNQISTTQENQQKEMDKTVKNFGLHSKIEDSLDLLKLLLQVDKFEVKNREKEVILNEMSKNYLVVIDEEVEQDYAMRLAAGLDFLSTTSNYASQMVIKLRESIDGINVVRVSKPILLCHSQVDEYYNSLLGVTH